MLNECDELSFWAVSEKEKLNCQLHINSYCKVEYCLFSNDDSWDTIVLYTWDVWHLHRVSVLQLQEAWAFFYPSFSLFLCVWSVLCSLTKAARTVCRHLGSYTAQNNAQTPFVSNYFLSFKTNIYMRTTTASYVLWNEFILRSCWSSRVFLSVSLVPSSVFHVGYYSAHSHSFLHCNF